MVCQLSVSLANRPCTSTTGSGWVTEGLQDQSLAPGGGVSGPAGAARMLARKVYGTGYLAATAGPPGTDGVVAPAGVAVNVSRVVAPVRPSAAARTAAAKPVPIHRVGL